MDWGLVREVGVAALLSVAYFAIVIVMTIRRDLTQLWWSPLLAGLVAVLMEVGISAGLFELQTFLLGVIPVYLVALPLLWRIRKRRLLEADRYI